MTWAIKTFRISFLYILKVRNILLKQLNITIFTNNQLAQFI